MIFFVLSILSYSSPSLLYSSLILLLFFSISSPILLLLFFSYSSPSLLIFFSNSSPVLLLFFSYSSPILLLFFSISSPILLLFFSNSFSIILLILFLFLSYYYKALLQIPNIFFEISNYRKNPKYENFLRNSKQISYKLQYAWHYGKNVPNLEMHSVSSIFRTIIMILLFPKQRYVYSLNILLINT